jgi:hypothetical protein
MASQVKRGVPMANPAFVRQLALNALAEARITQPPVDLDDLAAARALRIERNALLPIGVRAVFQGEMGVIRVIALPPRVERFPVAHELGHAILGDGGRACTEAMIEGFAEPVSLADAVAEFNPEATASAIAGNLLVPGPWLRRAVVKEGRPPAELENIFDVTRSVLWIALDREGLVKKLGRRP